MPKVLLLLILAGCAGHSVKESKWTEKVKVQNIVVNPGKVKLVEIQDKRYLEAKLNCSNGTDFKLFRKDGKLKGYITDSYFSKNTQFKCFITDGRKEALQFLVKVKPYKYRSERLYVNKRRVTLSPEDQSRVVKEQRMLNKIYANSPEYPFFEDKFITPLNSKITSYYGTRRVFNGHKKTQHLGTDYRARVGVKIKSVNKGKVAFAGNLFYTGNCVIVDHGLGIFTVYGHLSKIVAQQGEIVQPGSLLGLSGRTGRVSGPHLHWGVKVSGHWVDGLSLVKQAI